MECELSGPIGSALDGYRLPECLSKHLKRCSVVSIVELMLLKKSKFNKIMYLSV